MEEEDKRPEKKQRVEGISGEGETPEEPALEAAVVFESGRCDFK